MIKLYNTLTKEKEEFKPLEDGKIKMYVCGPTVYNYIHIGNARSIVAFDTIRRYFEFRGYEVNFVSNFTDVDDKIIKASKEMEISVKEVTDKFIKAFYEDSEALNVKRATLNPKATEVIYDIINFISDLIEKDYAYQSNGDVYFRARKFKDYGKLSGQSIDDLEFGASRRVLDKDQNKKEDPLDFALWKGAKKGEVAWESPFGLGRPGWHIECSVMATKYLGNTIDIHGGGQDLEFPHHENEIAQSQSKTGQKFANYWLHNGFVTIGEDDKKMSKSLGNFVTVHELLKSIDPMVLRFFIATTQYRKPIRYSQDNLKDAKNNLAKIKTALDNLKFRKNDAKITSTNKEEIIGKFEEYKLEFIRVMDDDFNAQNGISVIYEMVKQINVYTQRDIVYQETLDYLLKEINQLLSIFGIDFNKREDELGEKVEILIEKRNAARKQKDFKKSDEIRDLLSEMGIILEDTAQGTRWKKK